MAAVRERRQLKLHLQLPSVNVADRFVPRFVPPLSISASSSAAQVSIPATQLEKLQLLGHGSSGTVYKVQDKSTSKIYALKVVHVDNDLATQRQACREIEILRQTSDSPYIVHCYETYQKPSGEVEILMKYMDGGSLDTLLGSKATFSEPQLAHISRQVLEGLSYLHGKKIIHRDLKPSNLLVNKKMDVKIADFGVSKIVSRTLDRCNSFVGTCAYLSPERFDVDAHGGNYDGFLADIWSFGVTIMELCLVYFPLLPRGQRPDWATLMCAVCFGDPPSLPPSASDELRSFVECCLRKQPSERWTAAQLLDHPFLRKHPTF